MNGKQNADLRQQIGKEEGCEETAERTTINSTAVIVRQSGNIVNGIFSCGFVRDVFDLLSEPRTLEEIAQQTDSTIDRVVLALHDLRSSGVVIK